MYMGIVHASSELCCTIAAKRERRDKLRAFLGHVLESPRLVLFAP